MQKNNAVSSLRLADSNSGRQERVENFIFDYGRKVLYLIAALILLFILMYRMSSGSKVGALTDYMTVESEFRRFQESSPADALSPTGSFTQLSEILYRRPELHQKYDGLIAQTWIVKSEASEAEPFAQRVFERIELDKVPFYPDFSKATLLMSQHQHEEALQKAKALKEAMLASPSFEKNEVKDNAGEVLFALNLLRIAMLEQRIGSADEELQAWSEWQRYTQPANTEKQSFVISEQSRQLIQKYLEAGQASIDEYIIMRQRELKG